MFRESKQETVGVGRSNIFVTAHKTGTVDLCTVTKFCGNGKFFFVRAGVSGIIKVAGSTSAPAGKMNSHPVPASCARKERLLMKKERKRKARKTLRFTALLLIMAVSLTLFPVSGTDTAAPAAEPVSAEVLSLREENVKHFAVGNNTYQAVAYGHPVHKLDENGNWVDIDNSLTLSGTSYAAEDGRVSFTQSFTASQNLMTLTEDGTSVSMALLAELSNQITTQPVSFASVSNPQNNILTAEDAMNAVFSSTITYENALPDTDLEYTVDATSVKEYIVVNQPQTSYTYHFALTLSGLTAQLEEDGSVGLYTAEGEKKYTIPAPYMFDAAGNFSHAVAYTLQGESGKYFLTVTADAQWLNDPSRVWPVKIDPTIVSTSTVEDTYVRRTSPSTDFSAEPLLVVDPSNITYIKTPSFSISSSSILDSATLRVYSYFPDGVSGGTVNVGVYQIENNWSSSNLTWSAALSGINPTQLDEATISAKTDTTQQTPQITDFDITNLVASWLYETPNYGVALQYESGTYSFVYFRSYESASAYRPRIRYGYTLYQTVYRFFNYYDSTFSSYTQYIPYAMRTASAAYAKQFDIAFSPLPSLTPTFDVNNASNNILTDACPLGQNEQCNSSCSETNAHHKDIINISNILYEDYEYEVLPANARTIFWTNHDSGYCNHRQGSCQEYGTDELAVVYLERPVINILKIHDSVDTVEEYEAFLGYTLIHELAHTFGAPDVANNANHPYLTEDDETNEVPEAHCVMQYFDSVEHIVDFYKGIRAGTKNAFCSDCESTILDGIEEDQITIMRRLGAGIDLE